MLCFSYRSPRLRSWRLCALVPLLAAAPHPGPCRASEGVPAVGFIRSRYQQFTVLLLPVKPGTRPAGAPAVVTVKGVDGRGAVAPGEYYVSNWMVAGDDPEGHHWYANGDMLQEPITIRAGQETRVRVADPLQAHVLV